MTVAPHQIAEAQQVHSPVLLVVFNRPDKAARAVERLRAVRPQRVYVAADGPRPHVAADAADCAQTRAIVDAGIDWPCTVQRLYRDRNLGVRLAVSGGIDWFFEAESEGIILEDDIVAEPDFFRFCDELLERYRGDPRVGSICGTSYARRDTGASYHASSLADIWGWATWRDRWQQFDREMAAWPDWADAGGFERMPGSSARLVRFWRNIMEQTRSGRINSWGFRWIFTCWVRGTVSLFPAQPLVFNAGFGEKATNTHSHRVPRYCRKPGRLDFPLVHPEAIAVDEADEFAMWAFRYHISWQDDLIEALKLPARALRNMWRALRRPGRAV